MKKPASAATKPTTAKSAPPAVKKQEVKAPVPALGKKAATAPKAAPKAAAVPVKPAPKHVSPVKKLMVSAGKAMTAATEEEKTPVTQVSSRTSISRNISVNQDLSTVVPEVVQPTQVRQSKPELPKVPAQPKTSEKDVPSGYVTLDAIAAKLSSRSRPAFRRGFKFD